MVTVMVGRVALAVLLCAASATCPAYADCRDILPDIPAKASAARSLTAGDLARLRDLGSPDSSIFGPTPLALSPDGKWLAFVIDRSDPATNAHCRALLAIDLADPSRPRILDRGGELITSIFAGRGYQIDSGSPAVVTPAWSPDGRWIAWLRRDRGITQVWRVQADGTGAERVTRSAVDVLAFAWTPGGKLVFTARPDETAYADAIAREGLSGWLYDDRVVPNVSARPAIAASARKAFVVDPDDGSVSLANDAERSLVDPGTGAALSAASPRGARARVEREAASPLGPLRIKATVADGRAVTCAAASCQGSIVGMWWSEASNELLFLRREGWNDGEEGLYRWVPGGGDPKAILHTQDLLQNCLANGVRLICTLENATTPRRIVAVHLPDGRITAIFDPNPEFSRLRLGAVERLTWRNDIGLPAWGDLVLPPGYRRGQGKLPMVVVQYHSDAFLRGGTGDEYPIFAFAARGYAVLSIERPPDFATATNAMRPGDDINAVNAKSWRERRSLQSSLETGVRMAIDRGVVDPARIGITGLSDGSTTVRFALVNTHLFAAAAISTCCIDYKTVMIDGGIGLADYFRTLGYPPAIKDDRQFWQPISLELNAGTMRTPLLMQLSDDEYLHALDTFTALREYRRAVEMYVFPGEHHVKWQPAHRLAIYERNLDWFDYWLRDRRDPSDDKREQYARWDALRQNLTGSSGP